MTVPKWREIGGEQGRRERRRAFKASLEFGSSRPSDVRGRAAVTLLRACLFRPSPPSSFFQLCSRVQATPKEVQGLSPPRRTRLPTPEASGLPTPALVTADPRRLSTSSGRQRLPGPRVPGVPEEGRSSQESSPLLPSPPPPPVPPPWKPPPPGRTQKSQYPKHHQPPAHRRGSGCPPLGHLGRHQRASLAFARGARRHKRAEPQAKQKR